VLYPVVFPFGTIEDVPESLARIHTVLSIVLKRLPAPSEKLPLEDLIGFKRDPDTQYKFARFWHWTQTISNSSSNKAEVQEEIDWLVTDYSTHLKQLTKEVNYQRAEVLVATPLERDARACGRFQSMVIPRMTRTQ
jgi:hypothetical protein